jgi:putative transposase
MPQSFIALNIHLVFSTKNREPLITPQIQTELYPYIDGIIRDDGCVLRCAGGIADHVHLMISLGKEISIADLVRNIKANSSRFVHEKFTPDFGWQSGYGAFAVSFSAIEDVRRYIETQAEHHAKMTFKEEFVALLKRHHLEYDERYAWD